MVRKVFVQIKNLFGKEFHFWEKNENLSSDSEIIVKLEVGIISVNKENIQSEISVELE